MLINKKFFQFKRWLATNKKLVHLFKNASWLFGEKVLRASIVLVVGIWMARYLGSEQFGVFNYALSFVALFSTVASLGLDGVVIRDLVDRPEIKNKIMGTALGLRLSGTVISIFFLMVSTLFIAKSSTTNTIIYIIAGASLFQAFNVIDMYFQSKVMGRYSVYASIISLTLSGALKIGMIFLGADLIFFALSVPIEAAILATAYLYLYSVYQKTYERVNEHQFNWKFDSSLARSLLKQSFPLLLSGGASIINMRMDQVLLGSMTNFSVVGNYAVAVRLSELWFVLPGVIGASIFPSIIESKRRGAGIYAERVVLTIKTMALFAIPFAALVTIFSGPIIGLLYGSQYQDAAFYLAIHIWSGVPYLVLFVYSQVAIIENLTKLTFYISLYAIAINLILNYFLIPIYGGTAAVCVTLIVAWTSVLATIILVDRKAKIILKKWAY